MSIRKLLPLLASLVLVLTACGGDEGGDGGSAGGGTTGGTTAEATGAETGATGATPTGATASGDCVDLTGSETFTVTISGFEFDPSCFTASASQGITVINEDGAPHTFTLEDTGIDVEIAGGETFNGEAVGGAVEPGTYGLVCRIHPEMTGEVTVVA